MKTKNYLSQKKLTVSLMAIALMYLLPVKSFSQNNCFYNGVSYGFSYTLTDANTTQECVTFTGGVAPITTRWMWSADNDSYYDSTDFNTSQCVLPVTPYYYYLVAFDVNGCAAIQPCYGAPCCAENTNNTVPCSHYEYDGTSCVFVNDCQDDPLDLCTHWTCTLVNGSYQCLPSSVCPPSPDPCIVVSCNNGVCSSAPKCVSDPCNNVTCDGSGNCISTPVCPPSIDPCFYTYCDGNGNCITVPQNCTNLFWTGAVSNQWKVAGNWTPAIIPNETTDVTIDPELAAQMPVSAATNSCKNLTIGTGGSLTMTGGVMSVYGVITASSSNCFNLTGGTLKLYKGSQFPPGMTFNNLKIYMNPSSSIAEDNTYWFPVSAVVNGTLEINGSNQLPKIRMVEDDQLSIGQDLIVKGGLIGMDSVPTPGLHGDLPVVIFGGSTPHNINIKNSLGCPVCGNDLGADLAIENPNVIITQHNLSFYNLMLQTPFDLNGKDLELYGKILYQNSTASITNSKPSAGRLLIANQVPKDDLELDLRVAGLKTLIADASSLSNIVSLDQDLTIADTLSVLGTLAPNGHNITIGKTTSSSGNLDLSDPINNFLSTTGTLKLLGNINQPQYKLKARSLYNFILNSPGGAELDNVSSGTLDPDLVINGTATLTHGNFDIKNNLQVKFDAPDGLLKETPGNVMKSSTSTPAAFSQVFTTNTINTISQNRNMRGLGFIISTNSPLHYIETRRNFVTYLGASGQSSVGRIYWITNDAAGTGLNATISIKYDDSELNGIPESNLAIYRRPFNLFANPWVKVPSTVDAVNNTVTSTGTLSQIDISGTLTPNDYTEYALFDGTTVPRLENTSADAKENLTADNDLLLYPNPASDHLEVTLNCSDSNNNLEVYNLLGELMMNKTISADDNGKCHDEIDISKFPQGIYLVRVSNETGVMVKKFVKE